MFMFYVYIPVFCYYIVLQTTTVSFFAKKKYVFFTNY